MRLEQFRYPGEQVVRTLPKNFVEPDRFLFESELIRTFGEVGIQTYRGLWILPNNIFFHNRLLPDMYFGSSGNTFKQELKLAAKAGMAFLKTNKKSVHAKVLVLTDQYSFGFFHWFGDVLQKLEALQKYNVDFSKYVLTIPEDCHYSYVLETLKIYGVTSCMITPTERVLAEEAVHVPWMAPTGNYRPELMRHMRERFHRFHQVEPSGRRIFITRKKAKRRRILNEELLYPVLKQFGFEVVAMEELPFWGQYKLAAEAEIMVSLHGAGLTHMLWMRPGAKVMEIRSNEDAQNNCYFSLASALDLAYFYAFANKAEEHQNTQLADFTIDVDDVNGKIAAMVSN